MLRPHRRKLKDKINIYLLDFEQSKPAKPVGHLHAPLEQTPEFWHGVLAQLKQTGHED